MKTWGKSISRKKELQKQISNADELCLFKRKKEGQPDRIIVSSGGWRDMRPERQPEAINVEPVGCNLFKNFFFFFKE